MSGYSFSEIEEKSIWKLFLDEEDAQKEEELFQELLDGHSVESYENHWESRYGDRRALRWSSSVLLDSEGSVSHVISAGMDITEQKRAEQQIRFLAFHDDLTSLPNRTFFREHLRQSLSYCRRNEQQLAVMFVDVDHLKHINDSFGHAWGDVLLQEIARRLEQAVGGQSTLPTNQEEEASNLAGRFGGDEFTVVLTDIENAEDAAKFAQKLLDAISVPLEIEGHEIVVTASVGISLFPGDGMDPDTLVKKADMAMYHAKGQRSNSYSFYPESMQASSLERLKLENDLHKAINGSEFVLHYQPIVSTESNEIVGAEALVRWKHPKKGLMPPARFIDLAEETGMIRNIGEWVLRTVCRQIQDRLKAGRHQVPVAVNLSALQLRQWDLLEMITGILEEYSLPPGMLGIEITESTIMQDEAHAIESMMRLKELGIGLSIDDFGTGYSSLSHLRDLPFDTLKIDRSFIREIADKPDDQAIASAIIKMGHSLHLKVVAEGVESEEQLDLLRRDGCDEIQGFLFFRPMPVDDFLRLLDGMPQWTRFSPGKIRLAENRVLAS
jgi:diguanylate cyclase (GGDEF)-like protein/PAS domain S-box-containing protein